MLQCVGCKWYLKLEISGDYCVDCANPYCNVCFHTSRHTCDTKPGGVIEVLDKNKRLVKVIDLLSKQPGFDYWWSELDNQAELVELLESVLIE